MNFNLNKHYPAYLQFIFGLLTIWMGVLFFINFEWMWDKIQFISVTFLVVFSILHLIQFDKDKKKMNIVLSLDVILMLAAALFIHLFEDLFIAMFPFAFGIYLLFIGISRLIKTYVFFQDKVRFRYLVLLDAIITLIFSLGLVLHPMKNKNAFSYYLGAYFIFYGLSFTIQGFNKMFISKDAVFSLPVPVFISAFLPAATLDNIDKITSVEKEDKPADLEVFIYLRDKGMGKFGHMDFSYGGKTYSYGAFDYHTHKLWGSYGDGVLIVADRDQFLKHGNVFKQATVIKYGLKLNDEQRSLIEGRIQGLLDRAEIFHSDSQADELKGELKDDYDSYLANVYLNTHAETYKFKYGKFKTFFVLSTNCVNVAAYILQMKNLDLINIKGLVTPGTYLNYLNNEYLSGSETVVSRYVYEKEVGDNE